VKIEFSYLQRGPQYFPIAIGNKNYKCKIVFSRELTVSFNLLGRDNFFEPFLITFFEKDKKITLKEIISN
jgi:hypothetical protein